MARRIVQRRNPAVRFQTDGRYVLADVVELVGPRLFLRCAVRPPVERVVAFEWAGAGRTVLSGRVLSVGEAAPDGRHGVMIDVVEVSSQDGADALVAFVTQRLGVEPPEPPGAAGAGYRVRFQTLPEEAPAYKQPALRVAGVSVAAQAAPLVTGRPATTPESLQAALEAMGHKLGMYVSVPCAYWVGGAQYWGRAVRVSDRWVQVNTNVVVPGLGVRMRCDLTSEIDGVRRPVGIHGVLGKRQDLSSGGPYKAQLWVNVQSIDEAESPGLLLAWLERVSRERGGQSEPDE